MDTTLMVAGIVLAASFIQSTAGFGFAFFAVPLVSLVVDFPVAVVTLVVLAQCMNFIMLVQHRFRAEWKRCIFPFTLFSLPGIPLGIWLLQWLDKAYLQSGLGAILILYALYQWFVKPAPRKVGGIWIAIGGFIGGILGGALNSQGPPILVYTSLQDWDKDRIKGTLVGFFFATGIFVLGMQAYNGLVTTDVQHLVAWCLPALFLGTVIGRLLYKQMDDSRYRQVFVALIFVLGIVMILKNIF